MECNRRGSCDRPTAAPRCGSASSTTCGSSAVRAEPASERAQYSLIENFKTKLALLQDTVALINELRAGNDAAAARIVSGS